MAKSCIRWQACNIAKSADHHSEEKRLSYDYVRHDLIPYNEHFCPVKDLNQYFQNKIVEYTETIGQKPKLEEQTFIKNGKTVVREGWTPIREAVFIMKSDTTMADMKRLSNALLDNYQMRTLQIHIDRDEGHWSRKINKDGTLSEKEWVPNLHAHLVFDNTYPQGTMGEIVGKNKKGEMSAMTKDLSCRSIKFTQSQLEDIQTLVANVLGMERGVHSNKEHLDAITFKNKAEEEKAVALGDIQKNLSTDIQNKEKQINELEETISKKDDELIKKNTQIDELNDSLNEIKKQNVEVKEGLKEHALEIIDSGILDIKEKGRSEEMRELIESDPQNEQLSQNVKTVVDGVKDAAQAAIEKIEDLSAKETEIKLNIKSEAIDILESNILDVNGEGISENIKSRFENDSQNEHVIENFNLVAVGLQETVETLNNVITESQEIVDGLESKVKDLSAKENEINGNIRKQTLEILDSGILDIKEEGRSNEIRTLIEEDPQNKNLNQNFKSVVDGVKDAAQTAKELSDTNAQIKGDLRKQVLDIMNSGILTHVGTNTTNEVRTRILNDPNGEKIADTAMFAIGKALEAGKNIEEMNSKIISETVALTDERDRQISSSLMIAGTSKADVMKNEIILAIDNTLENKSAIDHNFTRSFAKLLVELDIRPSEVIANYISDSINQRNEEGLQRLRTRFQLDNSTTKEEICTAINEKAKFFDIVVRYSSENKIIDNYVPHATFKLLSNELKNQLDTLVEKAKDDPQIDKKLEDVATFLKVDMVQAVTDTLESKTKDLDKKVEKIDHFNEGMESIYEEIETTNTNLGNKKNELETVKKQLDAYQEEKTFLDSIKNVKEKINSSTIPSAPALVYPKNPFEDCRIETVRKKGSLFEKEDCFIIPVAQKEAFDRILKLCNEDNKKTVARHTNGVVDKLKTDVFADINQLKQNIDMDVRQAVEIEPLKKDIERERESKLFYKKLATVYRTNPEVAKCMTEEKENELFTKGKTIARTLAEPFILLYHKLSPKIICEKAKRFADFIFGEKPENAKHIELKKKMEETGDAPVNYKYDEKIKSFVFEFHKDIVEKKAQDFSEKHEEKQGLRRGKGRGI